MKSILAISLLLAGATLANASPGTQFTYQGHLENGGMPVDGTISLNFSLFDADSGGSQVGTTIQRIDTTADGGVISEALDFGDVFDGSPRWLEIQVDPDGGADSFSPLAGRIELLPVPYAIAATTSMSLMTSDGSLGLNASGDLVFNSTVPAGSLTKVGSIDSLEPFDFYYFDAIGDFVITYDDYFSDGIATVYDTSDPGNISVVYTSPAADTRFGIFDSSIVGNTSYGLSLNEATLVRIDLDGAGNLTIPDSLNGPFDDPYYVAAFGQRVFIYDDGFGAIIEVDASTIPMSVVGATPTSDTPDDILIANGVLFATYDDELVPYDISTPGTITELPGVLSLDFGIWEMAESGNYLYLVDEKVLVVDISDPTNPFEETEVPASPGLNFLYLPAILEDNLFAINTAVQDIRRYDIADPTLPNDLGSIPGLSGFELQQTTADRLYAFKLNAFPSLEICIFELSDGSASGDVFTVGNGAMTLAGDVVIGGDIGASNMTLTGNIFMEDLFANDLFVDDIESDDIFAEDVEAQTVTLFDQFGSGPGYTLEMDADNEDLLMAPADDPTNAALKLNNDGTVEMPRLGNATGTALHIQPDGTVTIATSSGRFKDNVQPAELNAESILAIHPVTYDYKGTGMPSMGYLAEELDALGLKNLVNYDEDGKPFSISYQLIPLFHNELLKQHQVKLEEKDAEIQSLREKNEEMEARLLRLETLIER